MRPSSGDIIRLEGVRRGKALTGPRSVNIHITGVCDRRCEFCWYFSPLVKRASKFHELPFAVLEKVLKDCAVMGVEEINLEGGEVTLHSRAADIFRLVSTLGMRLVAYTHLAYAKEPLRYVRHADRLTVNLSAVSPEQYRVVHGHDGFARALKNLAVLKGLSARYGKPSIVLTFIIYEQNAAELLPFLELAERIGADRVLFRLFKATREMAPLVFQTATLALLKKTVSVARRRPWLVPNNLTEIARVLRSGAFFQDKVAIARSSRHNDRLFFYDNVSGRTRCYTAWFNAYIDELGRVIAPCDNVGVCVAGNVATRSFRDIWFNSAALNKVRREASCGIDARRGRWIECRHCGQRQFNREIADALFRPRKAGR